MRGRGDLDSRIEVKSDNGKEGKKYYKWSELPKISEHISKREKIKREELGDYMAGLIDGDG